MYLVGNPRPTNPGDKMAEVARKRGWPILEFNSRGSGGLMGQVRNLLGVGSVVPAAYGAVGWGLLTRSRRRGINVFTTAFPQLLLAINGVTSTSLGEENLKKKRPAVFIFNHRNNFDPGHRRRTGQGQLDRRRQEGTPERSRRSARWASWSTRCSSTARIPRPRSNR